MNYREKMKEYLKEPNKYSSQYGKWAILNREQRDLIKRLLGEMDRADEVIKHQYFEIERLNNIIKYQQKDIEEYNDKLNEVVKERNKYLHIINEFEKGIKENIEELEEHQLSRDRIDEDKEILRFLQELKGDDKNDKS